MYDFNQVSEVRLAKGAHASAEKGLCFMEMVAWFAGEAHSDKPACASRVLGSYGITLNDNMPAALRDRLLKPLVPLIAGTAGTLQDDLKRAEFLTMWTINWILPIALRAAGLEDHAKACETAADLKQGMEAAAAAAAWRSAEAAEAAAAWRSAEAAEAAAAEAAEAAAAEAWRSAAEAAAAAAWRSAAEAEAEAAAAWRSAGTRVFELAVEGLRQAILIGPQEGFDAAIDIAQRHADLRALVAA